MHDAQSNILATYHDVEVYNTGGTLKTLSYSLHEHDLYGSTRLGAMNYYPLQVGISYTPSGGYVDTQLLWNRAPWYSLEYQDVIATNSLSPMVMQ